MNIKKSIVNSLIWLQHNSKIVLFSEIRTHKSFPQHTEPGEWWKNWFRKRIKKAQKPRYVCPKLGGGTNKKHYPKKNKHMMWYDMIWWYDVKMIWSAHGISATFCKYTVYSSSSSSKNTIIAFIFIYINKTKNIYKHNFHLHHHHGIVSVRSRMNHVCPHEAPTLGRFSLESCQSLAKSRRFFPLKRS